MMREREASRTEADDEHLVTGRRARQRPPDIERVPPRQQRIDLKAPGEPQHVLQSPGLDLRDVDRLLPLVDAGLHAVVADAVAGRGTDRVVDRDNGEGAEAVAARLHQVHLRDLFLERAAGERDAEHAFLEGALLLLQAVRAAVLALIVAPDAVIGLVERADEIRAAVGQRKAVAAAPLVLGQPQHRDPVALDGLDRHQMMHVEPVRHFEQHAAPVLAPALGRQCRPGGVALSRCQRRRIPSLILEPVRDAFGIAPLPRLRRWRAQQIVELAREPRSVDRDGVGLLDSLGGAALHEQPLDRIERRQLVMTRLQLPDLGRDAEQLADKIFEMRSEIDQQVRFLAPLDGIRVAPRRHQAVMQIDIGFAQMTNKRSIEAQEPIAVVKIGEREPALQGEIGHRSYRHPAASGGKIPRA